MRAKITIALLVIAVYSHADAWEWERATDAARLLFAAGVEDMLYQLHSAVSGRLPYRDIYIDATSFWLLRSKEHTDQWYASGARAALRATNVMIAMGVPPRTQAAAMLAFIAAWEPVDIMKQLRQREELGMDARIVALLRSAVEDR